MVLTGRGMVGRWGMAGVFLVVMAGCRSMGERLHGPPPTAKTSKNATRFFDTWNSNARQIDSMLCESVDVDGQSQGQPYSLKGKLAYQQPNRFRMLGKFAGKSEVDLGSNEKEIWFWIARAEPPAVYFCNRADLGRVRLSTPFQPDWLIEALGVTPLDANEYREGPGTAEYQTYLSDQKNPLGQPVTKRVVVDAKTNRVEAFELFSADRRPLARAQILEYQDDPTSGLFVPRKIQIEWPDAETRLTLTMSRRNTKLNAIDQSFAADLFRRGDYTHTQVIDMAAPPGRSTRPGTASANRVRDVGRLDERIEPARAGAQLTGQIAPASGQRPGLGQPTAAE